MSALDQMIDDAAQESFRAWKAERDRASVTTLGTAPPPATTEPDAEVVAFGTRLIGEIARAVDAAPPPRFVVRRLLVEGDYGVLGAERKWGKTSASTDLAINVAAGGSFLGAFPVDVAGPVVTFAGEGGPRKIVRRGRAIADHYGHDLERLPWHVYERAPKLASLDEVARLAASVREIQPVLIVIDPAYLALAGAETSNLASMGVLLERVQLIAQEAGAALVLSHHWNKTGQGSNADRFTGTGFAEWGRVLMSGSKLSINTDQSTGMTTAVCKLEVTGDEVPDSEVTFRRRMWVDDPDDLTSAMHYEVEVIDNDAAIPSADLPGMKPAAGRVLAVLRSDAARWFDHVEIGDELAHSGHPLKKRTILEAGQALVDAGLIEDSGGVGASRKTFRAHQGAGNAA